MNIEFLLLANSYSYCVSGPPQPIFISTVSAAYISTSTDACASTTTTQTCGATGFPGDSAIQLYSDYEDSLSSCADTCHTYTGCLSIYTYYENPSLVACYLMGNSVADTGYHNTSSMGSGYGVYDIVCFFPDFEPESTSESCSEGVFGEASSYSDGEWLYPLFPSLNASVFS